jgi:hypothetical protein
MLFPSESVTPAHSGIKCLGLLAILIATDNMIVRVVLASC